MGHFINGQMPAGATDAVPAVVFSERPQGVNYYAGLTADSVLKHTAMQLPNRLAILYGDVQWTYAELNQVVDSCASMLNRMGVKQGDRVGILLPNVPEYVIAANAIWRTGATVIAINPMMVAEEVTRLIEKTKCRCIVSLDLLSNLIVNPTVKRILVSVREHLPALQQLGYLWKLHRNTGYWSLPSSEHSHWFWEEIGRTTSVAAPANVNPDTDIAYILPTGGTTGSPKAVTLSHRNMVANAWQQYCWTQGSFGNETMLAVLPFFHSYGMSATVMGGTMMGATLVLHHRFNTRQVIRLIEDHRPTVFHAVPAMLVAMNDRLRSYPAKLNSIRWVISGGAPLEPEVGREFAKHSGALVVEGYGLSEASPVTHVGDLFAEPQYGTIGLPLPETKCRLVDPVDGSRDVASQEVGELIIQGPQVMLGYLDDPDGTQEAIRDGWLHTGDLAVLEPSDCYRIVGRKKDLVITSGFNVYPCEVESVLREHRDVLDAAVIGVADAQRGEIVKAYIVLRPGSVWSESSLHEHCERLLSKYKRPRLFERVVGDLPRNFLGKVIRRELRESARLKSEIK